MSSNSLRRLLVLKTYKDLHKTRKIVFDGDAAALEAARVKINEEYKKNKHVTNPESIEEMIKFSQAIETELRTTVVQAVQQEPGVFEMKLRPEVQRLENVLYDDNAVPEKPAKNRTKKCTPEKE